LDHSVYSTLRAVYTQHLPELEIEREHICFLATVALQLNETSSWRNLVEAESSVAYSGEWVGTCRWVFTCRLSYIRYNGKHFPPLLPDIGESGQPSNTMCLGSPRVSTQTGPRSVQPFFALLRPRETDWRTHHDTGSSVAIARISCMRKRNETRISRERKDRKRLLPSTKTQFALTETRMRLNDLYASAGLYSLATS